MSAALALVTGKTRPADLIRVVIPRLNKQGHIHQYLRQLEALDYDWHWARVDQTIHFNAKDWNELVTNLQLNRDWLKDQGGARREGCHDGRTSQMERARCATCGKERHFCIDFCCAASLALLVSLLGKRERGTGNPRRWASSTGTFQKQQEDSALLPNEIERRSTT